MATPASARPKDGDWTKPAAMAIPKEGYFTLEKGRYGPVFPKTPACYGFSVVAKVNNNVGSGYWTHALSSGQTIYLTESKTTALSAFEMYEFHTTQQGTMVHPGQTMNLDYSLTQSFQLKQNLRLQVGLAGYGQWQTTDRTGPSITPEQAGAHYKVNSLGFAANAIFPDRKASIGIKYFHEFECRSTYQGCTLQISGAITF